MDDGWKGGCEGEKCKDGDERCMPARIKVFNFVLHCSVRRRNDMAKLSENLLSVVIRSLNLQYITN